MIRWIVPTILFGIFITVLPLIRSGAGISGETQLIAPVPDPASEYVLGIAWAAISDESGKTEFTITNAGWVIDINQNILLLVEITVGETVEYWEVKIVWSSGGDITAKWAARIK